MQRSQGCVPHVPQSWLGLCYVSHARLLILWPCPPRTSERAAQPGLSSHASHGMDLPSVALAQWPEAGPLVQGIPTPTPMMQSVPADSEAPPSRVARPFTCSSIAARNHDHRDDRKNRAGEAGEGSVGGKASSGARFATGGAREPASQPQVQAPGLTQQLHGLSEQNLGTSRPASMA